MTELLILGVPLVPLTVALVELAKLSGLPTRFAGLAAIVSAALLVALAEIAGAPGLAGSAADVLLAGLVYGLAAARLYSQAARPRAKEP
ncbi:MAG TPA: hypothetical protein PKE32_05675, partial [Miltoncostaeaceae bacterium]|nr:hypothetical protein [Miltoncostaeaceae bacterium]